MLLLQLLEFSNTLIKLAQGWADQHNVAFFLSLPIDQKPDSADWAWVTLTPKQVIDVMVCMVYSPRKFYCQRVNSNGTFNFSV